MLVRTPLLGSLATAFLLVTAACAQPQAGRILAHWDHVVSDLQHAVPAGDGLLLVRRTAVRNVFEWFRPDGTIAWRLQNERPVTRLLVADDFVWYVEEQTPGIGHVFRARLVAASPGQPPAVGVVERMSDRGNWTDLVRLEDGRVLGFESLFFSRDVAPSAVKIRDLTTPELFWQDNFSYHYPLSARTLFLVSPIDRRIRAMHGTTAFELGAVNSLERMPVVRSDGAWVAWYGPHAMGTALFLADGRGDSFGPSRPRVLRTSDDLSSPGERLRLNRAFGERPIAWLGEDLIVPERDERNARWSILRLSVPDGAVKAVIPVPSGLDPTHLASSPSGDYIGLPAGTGSLLIRIADNFPQELPGVPITAWRFSPSGDRLYLAQRDRLKVVDLRASGAR